MTFPLQMLDTDDLTRQLNGYYHHNVEMSRDVVGERYDLVRDLVFDQIMPELHRREPRFDEELAEHGSYYQGLQIDNFDFDFGVKLSGLDKITFENGAEYERFYSYGQRPRNDLDLFGNPVRQHAPPFLSIPDEIEIVSSYEATPEPPHGMGFLRVGYRYKAGAMWGYAGDLVVKRDIIPVLVKKRLQSLLYDIRQDLCLEDKMTISNEIHGPALRFNITTDDDDDDDDDDDEVPIDFAPMVKFSMPFPCSFTWPRPHTHWPDQDKVAKILDEGFNLVAKKNFYWAESYAEAEAELVKGIDKDGGNRKKIHRIMKKINEDIWCGLPVIASYDLKNIWFWEIENTPDVDSWRHDEMGERFLAMTSSLLRAIRIQYLPHYFDTQLNLFKSKNIKALRKVETKICKFLEDPETALRIHSYDE